MTSPPGWSQPPTRSTQTSPDGARAGETRFLPPPTVKREGVVLQGGASALDLVGTAPGEAEADRADRTPATRSPISARIYRVMPRQSARDQVGRPALHVDVPFVTRGLTESRVIVGLWFQDLRTGRALRTSVPRFGDREGRLVAQSAAFTPARDLERYMSSLTVPYAAFPARGTTYRAVIQIVRRRPEGGLRVVATLRQPMFIAGVTPPLSAGATRPAGSLAKDGPGDAEADVSRPNEAARREHAAPPPDGALDRAPRPGPRDGRPELGPPDDPAEGGWSSAPQLDEDQALMPAAPGPAASPAR